MEYGPEHSNLIRQVLGEHEDPAVNGGSHGDDPFRGGYPRFTCLRERPNRSNPIQTEPAQSLVRSLLGFLHRHTIGRLFGGR